MRTVNLEGPARKGGQALTGEPAEVLRMKKLTGHLWARLMELEEDGLRMLSPTDPKTAGEWTVWVDFPGRDSREMVRRLRERWGVLCRLGSYGWEGRPPQEAVRFELGPENSFEEMDYVQDAVYKLLLLRH